MKDYYHFSANDFVKDENFRAWVWNPTDESNLLWRSWIAKHPEKTAEVGEAIALLNKLRFSNYSMSESEITDLWEIVKDSSDVNNIAYGSPPANRWWIAIAAGVAILMISVLYIVRLNNTIHYETDYGEIRTVLLPDSSTVILNANSSIVFSNNWNEKNLREVYLSGEAFFKVAHTYNHQPFQVKVGDGVAVEVLGTSFNVYHRKADTKVVLSSGQITLSYPEDKIEKKILMKPGELVEYKTDRLSKREVDPDVYASWIENKIILNQTSLEEMIRMARDNYGVEIRVESEKMLGQTVSGSMPVGDAKSFVNQIAMAFQLKIIHENDKILLRE